MYSLCFNSSPTIFGGYGGANWVSDLDSSKSRNGYVFSLGGAIISWRSAKQNVITWSTMEMELVALDSLQCGRMAQGFVSKSSLTGQANSSYVSALDNQATIAKINSEKCNKKSNKLVELRYDVKDSRKMLSLL